jgi:hypothetical protein
MLIRFVVHKRDRDSQVEQGLIHAAHDLRCQGRLTDEEQERVQQLLRWFNRNLPVPCRFARSRRPHACNRAISWFKPTADACLVRMQALAAVLHRHGCEVERLTTDLPGYLVYEDDYQVVAEVFRGEYRRSRRTICYC